MTILEDIMTLIAAIRGGEYLGALQILARILMKIGVLPPAAAHAPAMASYPAAAALSVNQPGDPETFCSALEGVVKEMQAAPPEAISGIISLVLPILLKFISDWLSKRLGGS